MAGLVVSPFLGVLFNNLNILIKSKIGLIRGVKKELKKLSRTLSTIKDVIDNAEEKQVIDKVILNWLNELKTAVYDADDVLDECAFEGIKLESEMRHTSFTKQVTDSFFSCLNFKQIEFQYKIGKRIKKLRERFDEIAEGRSKFHLTKGVVEMRDKFSRDRETSSVLTEPEVFGRDEDKENLVGLLLNNVNNQEEITICPILGIGGLGKTTLAQLVFNDGRVRKHFHEPQAWVCISDDFDVKRIIKAILVSLTGSACVLDELDPLQHRLQQELQGKRFLLVLDDVWNENENDWKKLKSSLRCGARGSSVILTTRLRTVASITGTVSVYHLKVLSEEDCWSLFRQHAFGLGNEEAENLVKIGKEIVEKCGGLPLAAKALGGLMRFKSEENEWLFVRDSEIWDLPPSDENNIIPALRLSYNHLPSHLRQCFAYCSIYPKDYEIEKEKLIHLWMANGFVQSKGNMEVEDVGKEIFNSLIWRCFFQEIKTDDDGTIRTCKMHDLLHDLACHIAMDECSAVDIEKIQYITSKTRHLSLPFSTLPPSPMLESIPSFSPCLRSLVSVYDQSFIILPCIEDPQFIFSSLIRLRALDLTHSSVTTLPDSIGNMKHLRYLNLSRACITSLPESVSRLRNLQTLKLTGCYELQALPKDMIKLSTLRHLDIRECHGLKETPIGIGRLTLLRTLSIFIVGLESGRGIGELQGLNLGGDLEIKGLENVKVSKDAEKANLVGKQNLRALRLSWSSSHSQQNSMQVLEGLQPHSNVRRLLIEGYDGITFPSWLTFSSLPNLVNVFLSGCTKCELLPQLGKLPLLKVLKIYSMSSVKFIDDEIYDENAVKGFMSLEELKLGMMPHLEGWSSSQAGVQAILPHLQRLTIEECPRMTTVPLPQSLQYIELRECNEIVLESLQNLPCLSSLKIIGFGGLLCFPEGMLGNLTVLQDLHIGSCDNVISLPVELENLITLKNLSISDCVELVSLPAGLRKLSSLKTLELRFCHGLKCLPELELSSLTHLYIHDCNSLTTMSDGLRHLAALEMLLLDGCQELEFSSEDFQHLNDLKRLIFEGLPKFTCFPEGIKNSAMLQHLSIKNCSNLMDLPDWMCSLRSLKKEGTYEKTDIIAYIPCVITEPFRLGSLSITSFSSYPPESWRTWQPKKRRSVK